MALTPGTRLGPYEIVAPLGVGGMGEVYRAHDARLDRIVALKVLPEDLSQDVERRARFEREARAASRLSHPHICTIHDFGEHAGQPYLVMELLNGQTLRERIQAGRLPAAEILQIGAEVADALAAAHAEGVVHRDITPANVFVTEHGEAKVLDFGLAKFERRAAPVGVSEAATRAASDLTGLGTALGTLAYMSPEQVLGRRTEASSDVFSLGVVLYELASGQQPFQGETVGAVTDEILHKQPLSPLRSNPSLPAGLAALIESCLRKEAEQRPTAAVVRDRLQALLALAQGRRADLRVVLAEWARRPAVWVVTALVLAAVVGGGVWATKRWQRARWVREVALPELRQLAEVSGIGEEPTVRAYRAALAIERDLAGDAEFAKLMAKISVDISLNTDPPGATVYARPYQEPDAPWERVGVTPVARYRAPQTLVRIKAEKEGYDTLLRTIFPRHEDPATREGGTQTYTWALDKAGSTPAGMVWISPQEVKEQNSPEISPDYDAPPRFLLDQREVTNREFKAFVDAGGYQDRRFWTVPFVRDGQPVTWENAMRVFVDRTGRPGPSTWEASAFPEGQADFPVTGVSWYEAAAYAAFAGKELPTVEHWELASPYWLGRDKITTSMSNFSGKGPVRVASQPNTTCFEVFDMAGNAREWCLNQIGAARAIRGGAWNDHVYMVQEVTQTPPFDRSERNGFRCMRVPDRAAVPDRMYRPIPWDPTPRRDVAKEHPVGDAVFAAYKQQYAYDSVPLDARVEGRAVGEAWVRERVSFTAAYGGERVVGQLFLPTNARPPYQVVVYFPGSTAQLDTGSSDLVERAFEFSHHLAFLLKNGRAVLYPVLKGTHERRGTMPDWYHERCNDTHEFAAYQRQLVQDVSRTIDYLETRPDIDRSRLAYIGWSWGGHRAGLVLAVESRFKTAIIATGGIRAECRVLPEVDPVNFVPRITIPVLLLFGRWDTLVPWERAGKPMYDLLGTPPADKVVKLYDTDHFIPRSELIKESLAWLDKHLGPVSRLQPPVAPDGPHDADLRHPSRPL